MILVYFALVGLVCFWIMKACDPFEEAADHLGRNMHAGIKGATINAATSSIPELLTTVIFLFFYHDRAGFASGIGTTAGSAVFNAMVIPAFAIAAVVLVLKVNDFNLSRACIVRDGIFLICAELILIVILGQNTLEWWHGLVLVGVYVVYTTFMYYQNGFLTPDTDEQADEDDDTDDEDNTHSRLVNFLRFDYKNMIHPNQGFSNMSALMVILLSAANISAACYLLAECVVDIAVYFQMNSFFVAVIVAAAATSVPDTIISCRDAMKGNYDDSISNAVGSNIFDICICLGLPLALYTIMYGSLEIPQSDGVTELRVILLGLSVIVIIMLLLPKIGLKTSIVFFSGYVFYGVYSLCRGMGMEWAETLGSYVIAVTHFLGL